MEMEAAAPFRVYQYLIHESCIMGIVDVGDLYLCSLLAYFFFVFINGVFLFADLGNFYYWIADIFLCIFLIRRKGRREQSGVCYLKPAKLFPIISITMNGKGCIYHLFASTGL
ncbi:hypothetical protein AAC387_Pa04g2525 [Persea americana]